MTKEQILKHVDHTLLLQTATTQDIEKICADAVKYGVASVCIPPSFVKASFGFVEGKTAVCTVIGFPNGYSETSAKLREAELALTHGASEIDMVINIGWLKDKKHEEVEREISEIKTLCGKNILKVIIECCLLTHEEKILMCRIVSASGADYIKTSTGFSTGGATFDDVKLFAENIDGHVKIKAAGGISNLADAREFLRLGASRLGTSKIIKLIQNEETGGY